MAVDSWRCRAPLAIRFDRVYGGHDTGRMFRASRPGEGGLDIIPVPDGPVRGGKADAVLVPEQTNVELTRFRGHIQSRGVRRDPRWQESRDGIRRSSGGRS